MSPQSFRLYIDESGQKEYGEKTSRYFVYAGVMVGLNEEGTVNSELSELKKTTFGTEGVELKSNWLRMPREREKRYLVPFGITAPELSEFVDQLYDWIPSAPIKFLAVVIDKAQMLAKYGAAAWHPSATAYQFLLQRYELQLSAVEAEVGHVTVDDMSGSSAAHNQWRDLLRGQHRRLKRDGCSITKLRFTHIAEILRFGRSESFHLLQLADLVAYNVFRQFRERGEVWDAGGTNIPIYRPLDRMMPRFRVGPDGRMLEGWGIVKWPRPRTGRIVLAPDP